MNKHTPGPWEFVDNSLVGPKLDDKPIWLRPVILRSETGINSYDAHLIEAAPELLEALLALMENYENVDGLGFNMFAVTKAHRAIVKATGKNK